MKSLKKWILDKEGLFIIITWWFIAFVIFTIMLGTSIKSVSKNLDITKETSTSYIQAFIESGDNVIPYNENISSVSVGVNSVDDKNVYKLDIRQYNYRYTIPFSKEMKVSGDVNSKATISYDLEVVEQYYISYNYTNKELSVNLIEISTEKAFTELPVSLKKTDSGSIHILWNNKDTGVEFNENQAFEIGKKGDFVVINGVETEIEFYNVDAVTGAPSIEYDKKTSNESPKVISFELVVEYNINSKQYTTKKYSTDGLNETETLIVNDSAEFFTEMIEDSVGINKAAFTLLIVSVVVEAVLLIGGVAGIIALKGTKDE